MSYTPEQLREVIKSISMMTIDEVIRAHATALEENAKLREALELALTWVPRDHANDIRANFSKEPSNG